MILDGKCSQSHQGSWSMGDHESQWMISNMVHKFAIFISVYQLQFLFCAGLELCHYKGGLQTVVSLMGSNLSSSISLRRCPSKDLKL